MIVDFSPQQSLDLGGLLAVRQTIDDAVTKPPRSSIINPGCAALPRQRTMSRQKERCQP